MKGPKNGAICASVDYNLLNTTPNDHCCLAISVGQPYHEGVKLSTAVNLINNHFSQCTLVLGDTLQRHNIANVDSEGERYALALRAGDEWLERNMPYFTKMQIPLTIKRWDEWLKASNYYQHLALVKAAYANDSHFKAGFERTIAIFIKRLKNRYVDFDEQAAFQRSLAFLLEEATIIMLMWQKEGFNYVAYPGEAIDALAVTYEEFVAPQHDDLLHWLPIKFKRYSREYIMTPQRLVFPALDFNHASHLAAA